MGGARFSAEFHGDFRTGQVKCPGWNGLSAGQQDYDAVLGSMLDRDAGQPARELSCDLVRGTDAGFLNAEAADRFNGADIVLDCVSCRVLRNSFAAV